jgi:hypothetical protein
MSPVRWWFGLVFVGMGVLAILDAAGVAPWSSTFEEWWPLVIVGWGVAEMLAARRVALGGAIVVAVGLTLLGDEQGWAAEAYAWAALFLLVGVAILVPRRNGEGERATRTGSISTAPRS